jgi:integrase
VARKPAKPWYRKDSDAWFICFQGKQINLGSDKKEAERRFHEIMATKEVPAKPSDHLAVELIDLFLQWTEKHRAPKTFRWYYDFLQTFIDWLPNKRIKTEDVRPFHVLQWADSHATWGDSCKRGAITAVQRAFLWAEKVGHIERSPIRHIEKPQAQRRDNPMSDDDFKTLMSHVKDEAFKDLLNFAWESGSRPQEVRFIEARHVNLERGRIEFPPEEAKGKRRWRMIYLTEKASEIVTRLMAEHREGKLFLNARGKPWKNFAICNRFSKLKEKLGKHFCAYDLRHSFCQRLLENGTDHIAVAAIMGHQDATMISKVYSHMSKADDHLREQLKRGKKS